MLVAQTSPCVSEIFRLCTLPVSVLLGSVSVQLFALVDLNVCFFTMSTVVDGHVPNYVDPETRVPLLLGVQISFTAVALIIVLLRLYTRKFIRHVLTAEDWIATVSLVCSASLQFLWLSFYRHRSDTFKVLGVASTISSCLGNCSKASPTIDNIDGQSRRFGWHGATLL